MIPDDEALVIDGCTVKEGSLHLGASGERGFASGDLGCATKNCACRSGDERLANGSSSSRSEGGEFVLRRGKVA